MSAPLRGSFNALILEIKEKRIKTKSDYPRDLVNIQDQSTGPALSCTHLPGYQLYLHTPSTHPSRDWDQLYGTEQHAV